MKPDLDCTSNFTYETIMKRQSIKGPPLGLWWFSQTARQLVSPSGATFRKSKWRNRWYPRQTWVPWWAWVSSCLFYATARVRINMRFWWTDCVWLDVWKASCGHLVGFNRDCCTKNDQDQELCPPRALMNHQLGDPKIQSPTVSMQSRLPPCRHTLSCRSTKNLYVWSSGQPLGPFLCGGLQFMAFCWQNGAATAGRPGPSDFEKILGLLKKRAMLVEPLSLMRASKHSRHEEHLSAMMGWEAGKYGKGMKGVSSR